MPATAGRVRMPANNRVHSSAALQTHGIWQSAIGYDPYAPNKDDTKQSSSSIPKSSNAAEPEPENAYASFQGLLALARITGSNADGARGACKKCGRVGHLTFQCRNFLSLKDDKDKDHSVIQVDVASELKKLKASGLRIGGIESSEESSEEEEESEDSDSDVDSEIERVIAAREGKKSRSKVSLSSKKKASDSDDDDEAGRKRKKEKSRRHGDSSSEDDDDDDERRHRHRKSRKEKRRRRSHRHSDDSVERRKRKSKRDASSSDSDVSHSDDSRVGRGTKRSQKKSRKHRREEVDSKV
ncbi:hypothetical protein AQUCO_02000016v1 [Aquilegia coerulea]|uniref:CCHC-type domain-containing protein n=1 Tax=Aquilegia coerulea TaxID=218851 RepID=A0A2G5DFH1_AQUCA|nr:hypothetical protein AQUCO_02000016v1 [Aquilegia coerulea]